MSAPDYFHWGGGRRYRTEDPVARLRYGGTRAEGVAHFAHGFLRRLHLFSLWYAAVCSGKRRCAKRERDRDARAPNRPTTQPAGSPRSCHTTNMRFFTRRTSKKPQAVWLFLPVQGRVCIALTRRPRFRPAAGQEIRDSGVILNSVMASVSLVGLDRGLTWFYHKF